LCFTLTDSKRVICFVELKDNISDLGHATEQVINTYNTFKRTSAQKLYGESIYLCVDWFFTQRKEGISEKVTSRRLGKIILILMTEVMML
jgi:hypothetical protein